ncbi:MAG: phosphoribosyltransferase family protein [Acidimicrobiia bacterium]
MEFLDRVDAGQRLGRRLAFLKGKDVVVLGLPRGGVPVAREVADVLGAPLDVIVVRKLGVPFQPELAMGAVGEDGVVIVNDEIVRMAGVGEAELAEVEARERAELERRVRRFRGGRPKVSLAGRIALVVDDGIATGSTARAACQVARAHGAHRVVLAVPVASPGWERKIGRDADELVALVTPEPFYAVGQFYADFSQTTDDEVVACLEAPVGDRDADVVTRAAVAVDDPPDRDDEVIVTAGSVRLAGHLTVPEGATGNGIVLFAHGSGSSRHSPRNRFVAEVLHRGGLGTLLFDLLTPEEERDRANVFDIELLAERLLAATAWLRAEPEARNAPIGYFGASTGAAAALWAAAAPESSISAVVSRGGRPDLAAPRLAAVTAPTLLIVGGHDDVVIDLNRQAEALLRCRHELAIVPGATHLFEEPGTLEQAARLACAWFVEHLVPVRAVDGGS